MCINIISTGPWSPWRNEEKHPLRRLQYVEEVIRLSKPRSSRIGGTVRNGWSHDAVKPPLIDT